MILLVLWSGCTLVEVHREVVLYSGSPLGIVVCVVT